MKITDIIRGVLDLVDQGEAIQQAQQQDAEATEVAIALGVEPATGDDCCMEPQSDELAILQQLAGVPCEPEYANEPAEIIAPLKAAYPSGTDMHASKNPADIRTNAPSMYPGFQAGVR